MYMQKLKIVERDRKDTTREDREKSSKMCPVTHAWVIIYITRPAREKDEQE